MSTLQLESTADFALESPESPTSIPLDADRITLGAGRRCTVHVEGPNARPLHCLILRNGNDYRIQRWSGETLLNGEEFEEAGLAEGDELQLADARFVIARLPGLDQPADDVGADEPDEQPWIEANDERQQVRRHLTTRCRSLLASLRVSRDRAEQLETNLAAAADQLELLSNQPALTNGYQCTDDDCQTNGTAPAPDDDDSSDAHQGFDDIAAAAETNDELPWLEEERVEDVVVDSVPTEPTITPHDIGIPQEFGNLPATNNSIDWLLSESVDYTPPQLDDGPSDDSAVETEEEGPIATIALPREEPASVVTDDSPPELPIHDSCDAVEPCHVATCDDLTETPTESFRDFHAKDTPDAELTANDENCDTDWSWDIESTEGEAATRDLWAPEAEGLNVDAATEFENQDVELDGGDAVAVEAATREELPAAAEDFGETDEYDRARIEAEEPPIHTVEVEIDRPIEASAPEELAAAPSVTEESTGTFDETDADEIAPPDSENGDLLADAGDLAEPAESKDRIDSLFAPKQVDKSEEDGEPSSFIERYAHLLDEDTATEPAPVAAQPTLPPEPISAPQPIPTARSAESDDDSIEDYMAQMMQRLRGESAPPQPVTTYQPPVKPVEEKLLEAPVVAETEPEPQVVPFSSIEELKKSQAPENVGDLSTFRELANNSARNAIDRAELKRLRDGAAVSLIFSGIGFGVGTFFLITAGSVISPATIGGGLLMVGSTWWGSRTANQLLEAIRDLSTADDDES